MCACVCVCSIPLPVSFPSSLLLSSLPGERARRGGKNPTVGTLVEPNEFFPNPLFNTHLRRMTLTLHYTPLLPFLLLLSSSRRPRQACGRLNAPKIPPPLLSLPFLLARTSTPRPLADENELHVDPSHPTPFRHPTPQLAQIRTAAIGQANKSPSIIGGRWHAPPRIANVERPPFRHLLPPQTGRLQRLITS